MRNNRHGCYEDYAREIDEEAERRAHDEGECEGMPICIYCLDDWEEQNREELDSRGYYNSKNEWTADEYHERYEANRRGILEKK